jgi:hypothetical protein
LKLWAESGWGGKRERERERLHREKDRSAERQRKVDGTMSRKKDKTVKIGCMQERGIKIGRQCGRTAEREKHRCKDKSINRSKEKRMKTSPI